MDLSVSKDRLRILFVAHDAYRAGATIFLLNMVRWLKANREIEISVAMRDSGEMVAIFEAICPTFVLGAPNAWRPSRLKRMFTFVRDALRGNTGRRHSLQSLLDQGSYDLLYLNTITLGDHLQGLELGRTRVLTHVHELPSAIRRYARGFEQLVLERSDRVVCVSDVVADNLSRMAPEHLAKIERIHGFVPTDTLPSMDRAALWRDLLSPLGIEDGALIVGFCGHGDLRKGIDLAVPLARLMPSTLSERAVHFLWVGVNAPEYPLEVALDDARLAGLAARFHFVGATKRPADWISLFDVFVLLSREDPFPLVVMEAAVQRVPTLCFDGGGGAPEFVRDDAGVVVPHLDLMSMATAITDLLADAERRSKLGTTAFNRVRSGHSAEVILPLLVDAMNKTATRA